MLWWTIHQLKSRDARTRFRAVKALAERADVSVAPQLLDALADADPIVRKAAAEGLTQFTDSEQIVSNLIDRLQDTDPDVKQSVIEALREIRNPRTIDALVPMLRDGSHQVRWSAANALDALGWQPEDDTQFAFRAAALDKLELAASVGPAALDVLVAMLKDRSFPARHAVVEALSRIGDERVVRPLESATEDGDSLVRKAAVDALSQTGDARVVETLLRMLKDPEARVRAAAVEALGQIGDLRALEPIVGLVGDANWELRIFSVQALGRLKDKRACEPLIAALRDRDHDVRQAAADALALLQDSRAVQPLVVALKDENSTVRQSVSVALRRVDSQWEKSEGAQQAIPELRAALSDKEYWVRQAAADALAKIGDRQRTEPESTGFADALQRKRNLAIEALNSILKDDDAMLRKAAADALGRNGDTRGMDGLITLLRDDCEWVAQASASALSQLNWDAGNRPAERARQLVLLQNWDEAAAMGAPAVEPLVEMLSRHESILRESSARTLGRIGGRAAEAALVDALYDNYRSVRQAAARSLRQLRWHPDSPELEAQLAIELGEWNSLSALGGAAVSPLLRTLEECAGDLETLSACVSSLSELIQTQAGEWTPDQLSAVLSLKEALPAAATGNTGHAAGSEDPLGFDCLMLVQLAERELAERRVFS